MLRLLHTGCVFGKTLEKERDANDPRLTLQPHAQITKVCVCECMRARVRARVRECACVSVRA